MPAPKIATCCYCGNRAALILDRGRHELSCSSCGAALHDFKQMPVKARRAPAPAATPARPATPARRPDRRKKSRRRKFFEELWDVVEDILD
ncbi:MAG: TFIIB zinc-binding [Rhodobacteraceae bacterium HLUCCA08]|nr:MAG: TFIIB zinc-binding [Rhodobacteraceae bacterium HLUCCA08]